MFADGGVHPAKSRMFKKIKEPFTDVKETIKLGNKRNSCFEVLQVGRKLLESLYLQ